MVGLARRLPPHGSGFASNLSSRPPVLLALRDACRLSLVLEALDARRVPTIPAFSPALVSYWISATSPCLIALDLDVGWAFHTGVCLADAKRLIVAISDDEDRVTNAIGEGFSIAIPYSLSVEAMARRLEGLVCHPREQPPAAGPIQLGDLVIDGEERRARWKGRLLRLSRNQFDQLAFFAANAGVVIPNLALCEEFFGLPVAQNSLNVAVHRLRRALPPELAALLESRRDFGYGLLLERPSEPDAPLPRLALQTGTPS